MSGDLFERARSEFWRVREAQAQKQVDGGTVDAGTRGTVTGGAHMDFFADTIVEIFIAEGVNPEFVHVGRKLSIPGFFRPLKEWDIVVSNGHEVGALVELKSQVGSLGRNFNNRAEEMIGLAKDVRTAFVNELLGDEQPFIAFLMALEDSEAAVAPTRTKAKFFAVDHALENLSYADRYQQLFVRLIREQLFDAACLIPASREKTTFVEVNPVVGVERFIASLTARAHYLSLRPGWS